MADRSYLYRIRQLFSSAYHNARWQGDYMLLAVDVPQGELEWFREKGILVKNVTLPYTGKEWSGNLPRECQLSPMMAVKFHLFTPEFKKWDTVVYLDGDIIIRGPIDEMTNIGSFGAVKDIFAKNFEGQLSKPLPHNRKAIQSLTSLKKNYYIKKHSFNAGVFSFKTRIITDDSFEDLKLLFDRYGPISLFGDQLIFNLYFCRNWQKLSLVFNVLIYHVACHVDVDPGRFHGHVLHFAGPLKPWHKSNIFHQEWKDNLIKSCSINLKDLPSPKKSRLVFPLRKFFFSLKALLFCDVVFFLDQHRTLGRHWFWHFNEYVSEKSLGCLRLLYRIPAPFLFLMSNLILHLLTVTGMFLKTCNMASKILERILSIAIENLIVRPPHLMFKLNAALQRRTRSLISHLKSESIMRRLTDFETHIHNRNNLNKQLRILVRWAYRNFGKVEHFTIHLVLSLKLQWIKNLLATFSTFFTFFLQTLFSRKFITFVYHSLFEKYLILSHDLRVHTDNNNTGNISISESPVIHFVYFSCQKHFPYLLASLKSLEKTTMQFSHTGKIYLYIDRNDPLLADSLALIDKSVFSEVIIRETTYSLSWSGPKLILNELAALNEISREIETFDYLAKVDSDVIFLSDSIFKVVRKSNSVLIGNPFVEYNTRSKKPLLYTQGGCYFLRNDIMARLNGQRLHRHIRFVSHETKKQIAECPEDTVIYRLVKGLSNKIEFRHFYLPSRKIDACSSEDREKFSVIHFEGAHKSEMKNFADNPSFNFRPFSGRTHIEKLIN